MGFHNSAYSTVVCMIVHSSINLKLPVVTKAEGVKTRLRLAADDVSIIVQRVVLNKMRPAFMMMALVLVGSCYPAKAGLLGIPHPPHAATKDKHARSEQSGIVRTSSPGTQGQGGGPTATSEKQVLLKSGSSPYSPQHAVGKPMLGKVGVHPWAMPTAGAAVSSCRSWPVSRQRHSLLWPRS